MQRRQCHEPLQPGNGTQMALWLCKAARGRPCLRESFPQEFGENVILFLLCLKSTTSHPFTRGTQGKRWQTYRQAVLFPVAAPLQNSPSGSGVGTFPPCTGRAQHAEPSFHTPEKRLSTSLSCGCETLLQSPALGDALNCTVEDPFSLSSSYKGCKETGCGWLLKISPWESSLLPSGLHFF